MRMHEPWCAANYRSEQGAWGVCDCGVEQKNAQHLAPFNPERDSRKRKKHKVTWAGNLPDQFCVRCEGSVVKAVVIEPHDKQQQTRVFAACLDPGCAWMREVAA